MKRFLYLCWLGVNVASAAPLPKSAPAPAPLPTAAPPGMSETKIREPVFDGEAYVYEAGREHARTVVLVHGLGDNGARDWNETVAWLAREYHVVSFDLPGFARSTKANVPYSPTTYAQFVKHVADKFAKKPFVLVGHSMGAVTALRYAVTHPKDVERLVVVDVPGILHRASFTSQLAAHVAGDFLPKAANVEAVLGNLSRLLLARVERSSFDPEAIHQNSSLRQSVLGSDPAKIAGLGIVIENLSQVLSTLPMPVLIVWGEEDTLAPPRTGRLLAQTIPNARLSVIRKAAHVPMAETPNEFRAHVEPFVRDGTWPADPSAAPPATSEKSQGDVHCENRRGAIFEGRFETLSIKNCNGAKIRGAWLKQLRVLNSTVEVEDSEIAGDDVALYARQATVIVTGGSISGDTAVLAHGSRFDFAGVRLTGKTAGLKAPVSSSVVFSICTLDTPRLKGVQHGFFTVGPSQPL